MKHSVLKLANWWNGELVNWWNGEFVNWWNGELANWYIVHRSATHV